MIRKNKPWRSSAFMRFCHEEMKPAPCCLCEERPWVALHHFGDDGGGSLKPSDNEVARVCTECHMANDFKRRALLRSWKFSVLESYQNDALKLNRAYLEHLEAAKRKSMPASRCDGCVHLVDGECAAEYQHVEPPNTCALDELNLWLATEGPGLGPDEQRDWLLRWANRRAANVIGFLAEPMREIAAERVICEHEGTPCPGESAWFVARRALKVACLEGVEDDEK